MGAAYPAPDAAPCGLLHGAGQRQRFEHAGAMLTACYVILGVCSGLWLWLLPPVWFITLIQHLYDIGAVDAQRYNDTLLRRFLRLSVIL